MSVDRQVRNHLARPDAILDFLFDTQAKRTTGSVRRMMVSEFLAGKELVPTPTQLDTLAAGVNSELLDSRNVDEALGALRRQLRRVRLSRMQRSSYWRRIAGSLLDCNMDDVLESIVAADDVGTRPAALLSRA